MPNPPTPPAPPKAYLDTKFLKTPDARPIRVLSEYLEPLERLEDQNIKDTILFFGSARLPAPEQAKAALAKAQAEGGDVEFAKRQVELSHYYEATRELAFRLTEWSKNLRSSGRRFVVATGGGPGIMEAANRGASEAGGENVGFGISLPHEQTINPFVTRKLAFQFHYFFMRKFWLLYLAKALVIMPGGFGTADELFESLTLMQTGKMSKPLPIVLFGTEYWDKVIDLEAMASFGTINPADLEYLYRTDSVDDAFALITKRLSEYAIDRPGLEM